MQPGTMGQGAGAATAEPWGPGWPRAAGLQDTALVSQAQAPDTRCQARRGRPTRDAPTRPAAKWRPRRPAPPAGACAGRPRPRERKSCDPGSDRRSGGRRTTFVTWCGRERESGGRASGEWAPCAGAGRRGARGERGGFVRRPRQQRRSRAGGQAGGARSRQRAGQARGASEVPSEGSQLPRPGRQVPVGPNPRPRGRGPAWKPRPELPPRGPAPPGLRALRKCGPRPGCCRPRPRLAASGGVARSLTVSDPRFLRLFGGHLAEGRRRGGLVAGLSAHHCASPAGIRVGFWEETLGGICGTERHPRRFRPGWFCTATDALGSRPRNRFLRFIYKRCTSSRIAFADPHKRGPPCNLESPLGS